MATLSIPYSLQQGFQTHDPRLRPIADKVFSGQRLSFDEGVVLYGTPDILAVGALANLVRESLHGNIAYFNVNRHINPTNVCVASCRLCAFLDLVSGLKERFPQVHVKAFTMVEIAFLARRAKLTIPETIEKLKAAGVESMPGGGAEIFSDRVRHIICDHKIDGGEWLETARAVHKAGLRSNATMLYGHVENDEDRVDHLLRLRELQDETSGFQTFIPLAFHPDNTALEHLPRTTGLTDLRQIAVGRLLLDNFAHIKAYWQMMTAGIAQVALRFGADDIDGTVVEEKIYHDAGATTPQGMRRADLIRLIREAGREPVERDTLYRPVIRTEEAFSIAV